MLLKSVDFHQIDICVSANDVKNDTRRTGRNDDRISDHASACDIVPVRHLTIKRQKYSMHDLNHTFFSILHFKNVNVVNIKR